MKNLEKRLSQLAQSQSKAHVRTLTDAERAVRIVRMLAAGAPGSERVRELLTRCKALAAGMSRGLCERHESEPGRGWWHWCPATGENARPATERALQFLASTQHCTTV
jgi:hypothetical protein